MSETQSMLDVVKAVQQSKKHFLEWSALSGEARLTELMSLISHLKQNSDEIVDLEAKLFGVTKEQLENIEYNPFFNNSPEVLKNSLLGLENKEPLGVCMYILPRTQGFCAWLSTAFLDLLIGNVVVVKPSSHQITLFLKFRDLILKAASGNKAAACLQFLLGEHSIYGEFLTEHPGIDALHIGGTLETAQKIVGAKQILRRPVRVESSSINSALVLKEANVKEAARHIALNFCYRNGLSNRRLSKVFVVEFALAEFKATLLAEVAAIKNVKPMLEVLDFSKTISAFEGERGKNLLPQGSKFWVTEDFSDCSELQQQELLLPTLMIKGIKYPADAAKWSNAQPFGRTVSIFAEDKERAQKLASKFNCGLVLHNTSESFWSATMFSGLRGAAGWGHKDLFYAPRTFG